MSAQTASSAPLPRAWPLVELSSVANVVNGGTPKSKMGAYWGGDVQWLTPKEMGAATQRKVLATERTITDVGLAKCSARTVPAGSVILSTRAPIGHLAINGVAMAFNQGCRGIVPRDVLDATFLYYFLLANRERLNDLGTGATFKELSSSSLKTFRLPLPPIGEQKRIVAILDQAFAALDRARAHAEANLVDARDVFKRKLDASFKNPARKESRIDELFEVGSSRRVLKSEWKREGVPFYRGREITRLALDGWVENALFISETHYAELAAKTGVPSSGDIVITAIGTIGNAHIVRKDDRFYFKDASVLWVIPPLLLGIKSGAKRQERVSVSG